jgi:hypothetical protein
MISKDFDGLYYLNYFEAVNYIVDKKNGILIYFDLLRKVIVKLDESNKENFNNKSKYFWLKEKYNTVLKKYKMKYGIDKKEIKHPELYEYLKNLTYL